MNTKQKHYVERVEFYTRGLTAVSTGVCPGCEQCRDEYGMPIACDCGDEDCELCEGKGLRRPTMEEFEEQWRNGQAFSEGSFTHLGCDICGSSMGGTKEPWHGVDSEGHIVHGDHACLDCVQYLANGTLPE